MSATFGERFADAFRNITSLEGPFPLTSTRLLEYFGGPSAISGAKVNHETVMGIPAAYACNRIVAEAIAMLPLFVFERVEPRGRRQAIEHTVYGLLHREPNPWMTSFQWRETMQGHLGFRGNAFSEIEYGRDGRPKALWPLNPTKMQRPKVSQGGTLIYPYILSDGTGVELPQSRVLHIRGLSDDGLWGYAPITVFREAFGVALAEREYESRFFGQGAQPGGVLQAKTKLTKDAQERLATSWKSAHEGLSMAHRVAVLEEGIEWKSIGMSNEDAQFVESRNFSIAEMARIWNVKRHKIQDLTESSYNNIEQETISHVTDTVQPWVERWEQQLGKDLFLDSEKAMLYPKFMLQGLLRGDMTARKGYYESAFDRATLSPNDWRELEDMELINEPWADQYYHQQTMVVAGQEPAMEPAGVSS